MYYIGIDLGTSAVKLLLMERSVTLYPESIHYFSRTRAGLSRSRRTGLRRVWRV